MIAAQGDVGDLLYFIVQGEIVAKMKDENDSEREIGCRKAGEYIGEMAMVGGETRMASMIAVGDVLTLCLDRDQFQELLERRPAASFAVIQELRDMAQTATENATMPSAPWSDETLEDTPDDASSNGSNGANTLP